MKYSFLLHCYSRYLPYGKPLPTRPSTFDEATTYDTPPEIGFNAIPLLILVLSNDLRPSLKLVTVHLTYFESGTKSLVKISTLVCKLLMNFTGNVHLQFA